MYPNGDLKILQKWKYSKIAGLMRKLAPLNSPHLTIKLAVAFGLIICAPVVLLVLPKLDNPWSAIVLGICIAIVLAVGILALSLIEPKMGYSSLTPAEQNGADLLRKTRKERLEKLQK